MEKDIQAHDEARLEDVDDLDNVKTVDTVHNDEAVRILAKHGGNETWDAAEEKKLRRKIDRRLMPILCITYGLQYYDKAMLGQAVRFPPSHPPLTKLTEYRQSSD